MIHKSSMLDEVSVMIPDEAQRKLFCYSVCSRKIFIFCNKRKTDILRSMQKSLIHMLQERHDELNEETLLRRDNKSLSLT
jgi:hypothetical protein